MASSKSSAVRKDAAKRNASNVETLPDAKVDATSADAGGNTGPAPKPEWALNGRERRAAARAAQGLPPKPRRKWPWLVVLLLLIGGVGYWYSAGGGAKEVAAIEGETPAAEPVSVMQVMADEIQTVSPITLRETVKVTGSLAPRRQLHLSAEVGGRVETVSARPGDQVEEGDLLVQIDIETLESQLQQQRATAEATRAQLQLAQTKLDRIESLNQRGLNSDSELEAGRANVAQLAASLNALETQVRTAELSVAHATVTAPFAGRISSRSVEPGQVVGTGAPLMTLVDLSTLEFEATTPISYGPAISVGQMVEVRVEGVEDQAFTGQVDRINPVAADGSRMLPIYITIENADEQLRGGMFASGQLVLDQKADALGVPVAAVRRDSEGIYVLKIVGDKAERQAVTVARNWEGGRIAEIESGLAAGDVVVSEPLPQLRPGAQVEIQESFEP